ncbi:peptidase M23 [Pollutimonas nitritireducens]|uniref:Peptidase M23 n=1 Tax=Pollutimonas nitritireducens TaxID=2045209 RepID=A0A2N4UK96_9BURK|nr:peptidase M23 [Pollutimonas nitritireducens]
MKNRFSDSSKKSIRVAIVTLAAGAAMAASAVAGAWVQSQLATRPVLNPDQERVIAQQTSRDSAYIRQNINLLAAKVGDLQARLITMDGVSKRIADAAGIPYTDPEVYASLEHAPEPVMDYITDEHGAAWTAQGLGRELDSLSMQLSQQKDSFAMLDLVLTRRVGVEAGLPTYTPVAYPYLSSSFGWRRNPVTGRHSMHEGLDFAAPKGALIHAASGGVVTEARYVPGYGKLVEIDHGNGLVTRYAHASSIKAKLGDLVQKGQEIARVGSTGRSTGAHLHFEVRMAGHALDPTLFLARQEAPEQMMVDATNAVEAIVPQVR